MNLQTKQFVLDNLTQSRPNISKAIGKSPKLQQDLDKLIFEAVQAYQSKHAKVADIYFERYSTENIGHSKTEEDSFKIYILVQFPKEYLSDLVKEISQKLATSNDATLSGLGVFLRNQAH